MKQFDLRRSDGRISGRAIENINEMMQGAAVNAGNLLVTNYGGNTVVFDPRTEPLWVRTTGAADAGAHAWEEVIQTTPGTWEAQADGRTGETDNMPLYMANRASVPPNTVCRAWLYSAGEHYVGIPASCKIPIAFRIDGGDAANGYEWTSMQQVVGSPAEWEEADDGLTDASTGVMAYEANGTEVVAGSTIFHGIYDACRGEAFFFGSEFPERILAEFLEDEPSTGDLYLARIILELVSSTGNVEYSEGPEIYAHPIDLSKKPTLEIPYIMFRTEADEIVDGKQVYDAERCCDLRRISSSGSGNGTSSDCSCDDYTGATWECTLTYGSSSVTLTLSPDLGGGISGEADIVIDGDTEHVFVDLLCLTYTFSPPVFFAVYIQWQADPDVLAFPSRSVERLCADSFSWTADPSDWYSGPGDMSIEIVRL